MGISSLPAPSEGVLTLLLVNTALSISLFKEIVRSLLHVVGLHRAVADDDDQHPDPATESFADRFRSRVKPLRFGADREGHAAVDCRVCLALFEPDSVVNRLPCGHLFHKRCLDRWLDYHHVTCPLCRTPLLPAEDPASCPWC
uniref:RING-H2 zinc finger protein RHA1a n=1 Tax=Anthurium amnicola TaxID=1678845 RepID=A0A1D1ZLL8_9ARAE